METESVNEITFTSEYPLALNADSILKYVSGTLKNAKEEDILIFRFVKFYYKPFIEKLTEMFNDKKNPYSKKNKKITINFINEDAFKLIYKQFRTESFCFGGTPDDFDRALENQGFDVNQYYIELRKSYIKFIESAKTISELHLICFPPVNINNTLYSIGNGNTVIDTLQLSTMEFGPHKSTNSCIFKANKKIILDECKLKKSSLLDFHTPHLVVRNSFINEAPETEFIFNDFKGDKFKLELFGMNESEATTDAIIVVKNYLTKLEFHYTSLPDGNSYKRIRENCRKLKSFVWCNNIERLNKAFENDEFMDFLYSMNSLTFVGIRIDDYYFAKLFDNFYNKDLRFRDCVLTEDQEKELEDKIEVIWTPPPNPYTHRNIPPTRTRVIKKKGVEGGDVNPVRDKVTGAFKKGKKVKEGKEDTW